MTNELLYDAFVSYSRDEDGEFAPLLRSAIQNFAKPWYRRRSLTIFLDVAGISLASNGWSEIARRIESSRHFVLLASPSAASSSWVDKEVRHWLSLGRGLPHIVVTAGEVHWNTLKEDFDVTLSTAVPGSMLETFGQEPFYARAIPAKSGTKALRKKELTKLAAILYAALTERSLDEVIGDDISVHRRNKVTATVAGALLMGAILLAGGLYINGQRQSSTYLTNAAERALQEGSFGRALRFAIKASDVVAIAVDPRAPFVLATIADRIPQIIEVRRPASIVSGAFSPDGNSILVVSEDGVASILSVDKGQPIGRPIRPAGLRRAVFSPRDANLILTSSDEGAQLWDTRTGQPSSPAMNRSQRTHLAKFNSDGSRIVTASQDGVIQVWDGSSYQTIGKQIRYEGPVESVAFSPGAGEYVLIRWKFMADVWDATTGEKITSLPSLQALDPEFSPDSKRILFASKDYAAELGFDGKFAVSHPPRKLPSGPRTISYSSDGKWAVAGLFDGTLLIWDVDPEPLKGPPKSPTLLQRHAAPVNIAVFDEKATRVASASTDGVIRVWNSRTGEPIGQAMRCDKKVTSLRFSPDERKLLSTSEDGTAKVWRLEDNKPHTLLVVEPKNYGFSAAAFSHDSTTLVTLGSYDFIKVWEINPSFGRLVGELRLAAGPSLNAATNIYSYGAAVSVGSGFLTAVRDGRFLFWDFRGGRISDEKRNVTMAALSSDGTALAVVSGNDVEVRRTGEPIVVNRRSKYPVLHAALRHDGEQLMIVTAQDAVLWNSFAGGPIKIFPSTGVPLIFANFSPDGKRVVIVEEGGTARVWSLDSGLQVGPPLQHPSYVSSAVFSSDGNRVLTGTGNGGVQVWDVKTGAAIGKVMSSGPGRGPAWASFSPDEERVIVAFGEGKVMAWDLKWQRVAYRRKALLAEICRAVADDPISVIVDADLAQSIDVGRKGDNVCR